ncbi:MAG: Abi-alpha family protein [Bacteroidota bacterium]
MSTLEQAASDADGVLKKLLGPFADEAGQLIAMPLRERRLVKTAEMLRRVEEKVQKQLGLGATRKVVPARGVVPLLEAASLENDMELQEQYENLLAHAALGERTQDLASFSSILRQMSPSDAGLLQLVFNRYVGQLRDLEERGKGAGPVPALDLKRMREGQGVIVQRVSGLRPLEYRWTPESLSVSLDNLFRLGLLRDLSEVQVLIGDSPIWGIQRTRRSTTLRRVGIALRDREEVADGVGGRRVFQPYRERIALSALGLAFALCVSPMGLELPDIQLNEP